MGYKGFCQPFSFSFSKKLPICGKDRGIALQSTILFSATFFYFHPFLLFDENKTVMGVYNRRHD